MIVERGSVIYRMLPGSYESFDGFVREVNRAIFEQSDGKERWVSLPDGVRKDVLDAVERECRRAGWTVSDGWKDGRRYLVIE